MLLPSPPRRAYLIGFAVTTALVSGAVLALVLVLLGNSRWALTGILVALVVVIAGWSRPDAFALPYRAYNSLADLVSRFTVFGLSAICFYVVVLATGRAGSGLNLSRGAAAGSVWTARRPQPPEAYFLQFTPDGTATARGGWVRDYLAWAWDSGNLWLVFLLPFLTFLSLNRSKTATVPSDVYTLF